MLICSIDPGKEGAWILLKDGYPVNGGSLPYIEIGTLFYPPTQEYTEILDGLQLKLPDADYYVIEYPIAMPGVGITTVAKSFQSWGVLFNTLTMKAKGMGSQVVIVRPKEWVLPMHQKFCRDAWDERSPKLKSREVFNNLWPLCSLRFFGLTPQHEGGIDAALLGFYYYWSKNPTKKVIIKGK